MLTTGHVVFCEVYVSVDKLAAVPILCVEQLVLPLFCMNASQSTIALCGLFLFDLVFVGS